MYLRNILLIFSALVIGFAISLYFQTGQDIQTVNWDQYKNLSYSEGRSHSLSEINQKLSPYNLENLIQVILDKNRLAGEKTRVMELRAGNGRALMELQKKFPEVEFYALNRQKTHTFYRRESFIMTAQKFGIMDKDELQNADLPYVQFQELDFGGTIPYNDSKFDLIYSHETLIHIKYKFELMNEILRVLKTGAQSLHTGVSGMTFYLDGVSINWKEAFHEMRKRGFEIGVLNDPQTIRFRRGEGKKGFPVVPHQPLPTKTDTVPEETRRPEMGYNLI